MNIYGRLWMMLRGLIWREDKCGGLSALWYGMHTDMSLATVLCAITHRVAVTLTPRTLTSSPKFSAACHWTRSILNDSTTQ